MTKRILWLLALLPSLAFGGLEDLTGGSKYIDDLVATNPLSNDAKSEGDDHIRGVKNVLKNTFPNVTGAVTATQTELNILDGVTSTTAELNILDGVTATASELNILDGVTSTAAELNILDGVTATATELNYNDVTTLGTTQASKVVTTNSSNNTIFTGAANYITHTAPRWFWNESDQAANGKLWGIQAASGLFQFMACDDAVTSCQAAISVSRVDNTIDTIQFDHGTVDIDENLNVDGNTTLVGTLGVTGAATLATVDINAGAIDGTAIGANSKSTAEFTTLSADSTTTLRGNTDIGDATSDTITATGRFDSDLVPSTDSARDLGTSSLQWAEAHIDAGFIDDIETSGDISHTKACATNYTRAAPGLCVLTTGTTSVTNLTTDACTSITFPTGSNYVQVKVQVNTGSAGSAGSRLAVITMYSDTGCSTQSGLSVGAPAEEVAGITANKAMANNDGDFIIPNNSSYRIKLVDDTANKGGGWFNIPMYWDN